MFYETENRLDRKLFVYGKNRLTQLSCSTSLALEASSTGRESVFKLHWGSIGKFIRAKLGS